MSVEVGQFFPSPANPVLGTQSAVMVITAVLPPRTFKSRGRTNLQVVYAAYVLGEDPRWWGYISTTGVECYP